MEKDVMPIRIQRSRKHTQVSPNGLPIVYVGRPGKFGNPYITGDTTGLKVDEALRLYEKYIQENNLQEMIKRELAGKNLSCWCSLKDKCHADILLKLANNTSTPTKH